MRTSGPVGPAASSHRAGDTCHLDVADRFGNMVSATPSGGWLQSSPVIPGLGFCLGTRAQMFTLTPGLPATLAPGKRRPALAQPGAAGPRAVPRVRHPRWRPAGPVVTAVLPQPPEVRHEPAAGDRLPVVPLRAHAVVVLPAPGPAPCPRRRVAGRRPGDRGTPPPGHLVNVRPAWSLGRVSAVARRDGILYAAANPRGMQGYAQAADAARRPRARITLPSREPSDRPPFLCHHIGDDACHGRFLRDGTTWPTAPGGGIGSAGGSRAGEQGQTKQTKQT